MIRGKHFQNAYVTRDLDAALAALRNFADVRMLVQHDARIDVRTPEGIRPMHNRIALAWVEGLQVEIIEPVDGAVEFYRDLVPADGSVRFHHIAMRVTDWDSVRSGVNEEETPIVIEGEAGPLKFLYLDARAQLGHYVEYTYMPDEIWAAQGGR